MTLEQEWWVIYYDHQGKWGRHDLHGCRDAVVDMEIQECKMRLAGVPIPEIPQPQIDLR